jgi:glycosyltransferase involved in cell wall biosynthesis
MTKKIKIVFDASPLLVNKTGVAYYTELMVTNLAKAYPHAELVGFYYNFLGRHSTAHFPSLPNVRFTGIHFLPSKVTYQLRRWHIGIPIELLLWQKPDFILYDNFLGYPSLFKTPSAPVIHDLTYLDLPEYVSAKNQHDLELLVPKEIKRSRFIITVSEFSKAGIAKTYQVDPSKILVTPIPPSRPVIHDATVCAETLKTLGIHKKFIVTVGTIEPRKNIIKLLSAYTQLPQEIRDQYALVIAGRVGWDCEAEVAEMAKVARKGYDVHHLGYVSEKDREILYQSASLFVSASHYEGFGMPILEAMNYGTPCAVSDIAVFHEVGGNAAIYFDQEKPSVIASHLESLLSNQALLDEYGERAKKQVALFKWPDIARSVFERIVNALQNK